MRGVDLVGGVVAVVHECDADGDQEGEEGRAEEPLGAHRPR